MFNKTPSNLINGYYEKIYSISQWSAAFIIFTLLAFRVSLIFSYSGELYGIDNNFVYATQRILQGHDIYTDPEQLPYAITMYLPLYFSVSALIGKILCINTDEPIYIYQLCRTVAFLCDIITCIFLYRIIRKRYKAPKESSLLAVAIFAAILCFLGYTFSRSDAMILAFFSGFMYVLSGPASETQRNLWLLSCLSVACIFSKQNGIIIPVLTITFLSIQSKWKAACQYLVFSLLLLFAMLILYRYVLSYPYFFDNTFQAIQNRISLSWFYVDIFKRMMNSLWMLPVYIGLLVSLKQWASPANPEDKSFSSVFILLLVFSLGASLKWGSSVSYLNESMFLSFVILFRYFQKKESLFPVSFGKTLSSILLPLVFLFTTHTIAQGYLFFIQNRKEKKALYLQQKEIGNYLLPKLGNKYVFNMYQPNTSFLKTILSSNLAAPNFDIIDYATYPDGTFDYSGLAKDVENGKISFLIAAAKDSVTGIWGIPLQHYRKDTVMYDCAIYRFEKP